MITSYLAVSVCPVYMARTFCTGRVSGPSYSYPPISGPCCCFGLLAIRNHKHADTDSVTGCCTLSSCLYVSMLYQLKIARHAPSQCRVSLILKGATSSVLFISQPISSAPTSAVVSKLLYHHRTSLQHKQNRTSKQFVAILAAHVSGRRPQTPQPLARTLAITVSTFP